MTNTYARLPNGAGRRLRQRLIWQVLLHLLLAVAVLIAGFVIFVLWPITDVATDSVWQTHAFTNLAVSVGTTMTALRPWWLLSAIRGDSLYVPDVIRHVRGCRVWWITSLILDGLAALALIIACTVALRTPGGHFSVWYLLAFSEPVASALFVSVNHSTMPRILTAVARAPKTRPLDGQAAGVLDGPAVNTFRANGSRRPERGNAHGSWARRRR